MNKPRPINKLRHLLATSRILLVLALLALFAGCSDDDEKQGSDSQHPEGSLAKLFEHPVIQGCGSCHGPQGLESAGPNLTTKASFHTSLVGKNRTNYPNWLATAQECAGKYVVANSVKDSSLLSIVSNQNGATCAAYTIHTVQGGLISGAALSDFIKWVENGAPAN